jgi:hypothetical protein
MRQGVDENDMTHPFTKSNYERVPDDHYPTIDPRCSWALRESWDLPKMLVDPCAPNGSGLLDNLAGFHYIAALDDYRDYPWKDVPEYDAPVGYISNPPYSRPLVDEIVGYGVKLVENDEAIMAAFLLRTQWDHAKSRAGLFSSRKYAGQIKLQFRPWWSEERKAAPIHNYVWHVWDSRHEGPAIIKYWGSDR